MREARIKNGKWASKCGQEIVSRFPTYLTGMRAHSDKCQSCCSLMQELVETVQEGRGLPIIKSTRMWWAIDHFTFPGSERSYINLPVDRIYTHAGAIVWHAITLAHSHTIRSNKPCSNSVRVDVSHDNGILTDPLTRCRLAS